MSNQQPIQYIIIGRFNDYPVAWSRDIISRSGRAPECIINVKGEDIVYSIRENLMIK
jgi:hypothetical protein